MTRLLITSGADFTDRAWACRFLDRLHAERAIAAVLHTPAAELLATDWAAARGLPTEPAPDDLAGVDAVAALPGEVPARVYALGLELLRPDHLVLRRGADGHSRTGILCVRNVAHAVTGSVRVGRAVAVSVVDGGQVRGAGELHADREGRWSGVILLDGTRWAASGLPHDGRLLAELVMMGGAAEGDPDQVADPLRAFRPTGAPLGFMTG